MCALLLIAGTVVLAARLPATMQPGPDVVVRELGAGKLIVAARNLPDPNFRDTVVLLIEYSHDGVAGLVINRPSDVPLSRALPGVEGIAGTRGTAFLGGPVSRQGVLALSRTVCDGCRRLGRDVYLVNTGDALKERLASGADARQLRVYLGYAGWGRGQLEDETRKGAWHVLEADARVVFDPHPETVWRRTISRTEGVLARMNGWPSSRPTLGYYAGMCPSLSGLRTM